MLESLQYGLEKELYMIGKEHINGARTLYAQMIEQKLWYLDNNESYIGYRELTNEGIAEELGPTLDEWEEEIHLLKALG